MEAVYPCACACTGTPYPDGVRISDLDYHLPPGSVAQEPPAHREDARLLVLLGATGELLHRSIRDLPELLAPGDLLVLNDTRVLPARLLARRATGGRVEVLVLREEAGGCWHALARAGGTLREGERLALGADDRLVLRERLGEGRWVIEGEGADVRGLMERHGCMPLPPYIRRDTDDARAALDRERYQTTFARREGAIAAPTAGLHLTPSLLEDLERRGVGSSHLTLHVGLGTFEPVRSEHLEDHAMHEERYEIPASTVESVRRTREAGGRVVAVGTTSVRALEASAEASDDGLPCAESRTTNLLITPGYRFRVVDAMLTNFHLPRSTLVALVAAFAGRERILDAYAVAVAEDYRFYSYGDAMLLL